MSSLFPEVDEEATIGNVKDLLNDFHRIKRSAKRATGGLKSPVFDDMPKGTGGDNQAENAIVEHVSAQQIYYNIVYAIESIEKDDLRQILQCKHIRYGMTDEMVWMELAISESTYYRRLKQAYLTFAEIYGIQELRVFKK